MRARFEPVSLRQRRIRFVCVALVSLLVLLVAGCGGRAAVATKDNGCRAVALAAERWLAAAAPARRDETLRVAVEVIELCQRPGLGPLARSCVSGAADVAALAACPGLGLVSRLAPAPLFPHPVLTTEDEFRVLDGDDDSDE